MKKPVFMILFLTVSLLSSAEFTKGTFIKPRPNEVVNGVRASFKSNFPAGKKHHRTTYYLDTEFVRQMLNPPEKPLNISLTLFEPNSGLHFLSGVADYEDGSQSIVTIPVYVQSKGNVPKDLPELTRLAEQIMPAYLRCRRNELEYGAMVNVLGKPKMVQPVSELNGKPRTTAAFLEYLELLKRSNSEMEKFIRENQEEYRRRSAQWKGLKSRFNEILDRHGYNGRYYLNSYTRGTPEMRFLIKHGVNFFFPYPNSAFQSSLLGMAAEGKYYPVVLRLSRLPSGKDYDRKKFPDQRHRIRGDFTREEYRLLAQRYPENIMGSLSEWGWNQHWACYNAPRRPTDRLDAEQLMIDSMRQYLDFWLPGIPVFSWDNFGVPGIQYEGGVDLFLIQLFRGENIDMATASLRGDSKAYGKRFAVSSTELSWLPSHLDWGLVNNGNKKTLGGIYHVTGNIYDATRQNNKPNYAPEEVWRLYKYSFISGASVIGHENGYFKPLADRFISYMKRHPAIGFPENRIAVMRGQGDSTTIAVRGDDARNYGSEMVYERDFYNAADVPGCRGLSDWGYNSHLRDYNLMNIFFPDFGNAIYNRRQFTGSPFGAIDILYGRAPLRKEQYDLALVVSVNIMEKKQIAKFKKFVADGGLLILNLEQCKGRRRTFDPDTLDFLKEVCGIVPGKVLPESDDTVIWNGRTYPAPAMILNQVGPGKAEILAVNRAGLPVCLKHRYGKGMVYLTLSQWHWRMPIAFMNDLLRDLCKNQNLYLKFSRNNKYISSFVNRLKNGKGVIAAVFNNQHDHTAQQHYRRLCKHERLALPGTSSRHWHIQLKDDTPKILPFDFGKPFDFSKYDEVIMNLRADGRKPGGSFNIAFYDADGRKATWKHGIALVSRMVGSEGQWFFKGISPQLLKPRTGISGGHFGKNMSFDSGFDWTRVAKMEFILARGQGNPALDYDLYLKDFQLQNLFWKQTKDYQRPSMPFQDTLIMDVKPFGLSPEETVVYSCGEWWQPVRIPHQVKNGEIVFDADIQGDFGEYLFCRKGDVDFQEQMIQSGKLPPEHKNWRDVWK